MRHNQRLIHATFTKIEAVKTANKPLKPQKSHISTPRCEVKKRPVLAANTFPILSILINATFSMLPNVSAAIGLANAEAGCTI